jgi:hypothetical protein
MSPEYEFRARVLSKSSEQEFGVAAIEESKKNIK